MAETATAAKKKRTTWHAAKGNGKKTCSVQGCKRPYRAKSYCFFHYDKWRDGALPHNRYKTCSKEECRKRVFKGGLCEAHYNESTGKAPAAADKAAPAAAPASP